MNTGSLLSAGPSRPAPRAAIYAALSVFKQNLARASIHLWLLLGISLVAYCARCGLQERYAKERRTIEAKERATFEQALLKTWNSFHYASGDEAPYELTKRVKWDSLGLSPAQKAEAQTVLTNALSYLMHPTFESYYKLKTNGLSFKFHLDTRAAGLFGTNYADIRKQPPYFASRAVWDCVLKRRDNSATRISALCVDGVAAITTQTNSIASVIGGALFKRITVAAVGLEPGFVYATEDQKRPNVFLNLSFYARSNVSTNAGPVHLSFIWNEPTAHWAPHLVLSDTHLNLDNIF